MGIYSKRRFRFEMYYAAFGIIVNIIVDIIITMCIFAHIRNGRLVSSQHDYYKSVSLCKRLRRPLVHLKPYFYVRIICISFLQQEGTHAMFSPLYDKTICNDFIPYCNAFKIPIEFSLQKSRISARLQQYYIIYFIFYFMLCNYRCNSPNEK